MDLPTAREIELETLLRQKDAQVSDLSDEVTRLRQYLSTQPGPSTADPITLPPALISILLPHVNNATREPISGSTSSTVTTALTQRARLLQEENDELYDILKRGETGKLKEEVRGLRRVVNRLEGALRESHQVILNMSAELDKSYDIFISSNRPANSMKSYSQSPINRASHLPTSQMSSHSTSNGNGNNASNPKNPPTGPRAYKKPRLSEPLQTSPPRAIAPVPNNKLMSSRPQTYPRERITAHAREHYPRDTSSQSLGDDIRGTISHAHRRVDEDSRKRPRSPTLEKEMDRDRDRDTDRLRERERERERERDRLPRRNGSHGSPADRSGGGRRVARGGTPSGGYGNVDRDRTLAERMGLSNR